MRKLNRIAVRCGIVVFAGMSSGYGHDAITTKITYNREIIRLIVSHCGTCHHDGGSAFSLMTCNPGVKEGDQGARAWAKAIGEEVLQRRMPPWGAVKGFDDFRSDKALTEEQLELIVDWEEGGAPEGDPKDLPKEIRFPADPPAGQFGKEVIVSGDYKLITTMTLDGIEPKSVPDNASYQVTAELPDGDIEPLVWFQNYKKAYTHTFVLRKALNLPAGTMIRGVPPGDSIALLPAGSNAAKHIGTN